jgi:signal transduction histidine kinase
MTSLPSAIANPAVAEVAPQEAKALNPIEKVKTKEGVKENGKAKEKDNDNDNEQFLLQAFHSFAETADSLERSYGMLRSEVARLHGELAESNVGLARSLEENRQMRQHLDRILDGLPCGVLVARASGAISLVNPEAKRLLSAASKPPAFESLSVVPAELRDLLNRAQLGPGEQEQCFTEGSGGERWLAARHAAVEDAEDDRASNQETNNKDISNKDIRNKDCVSIFILRDVSEAKRMVQEREKLRREQALAEMSAILAHEIRNPLGSLELFAGLLAEAGLSPECQQWVEHVQAGLRTLAATVNNVLHFHSLPAPERVPTDLGRLLDWAGGFLVPMAHQARVELCLRNRLQGVWFTADRHRLEQVLLNLVLNALRAMPGGGWVEVAGHRIHDGDAAAAAICISDTGPGIQPEQAAKIFEPGFSTRAGSPGLGLAVCRKIVEQHGGSLAAANRAGVGASFTLTFPLGEQISRESLAVARVVKEASQTRD